MTLEQLKDKYEMTNYSEFADDYIYGVLDDCEDKDDDYIVDNKIKSAIRNLNKDLKESIQRSNWKGMETYIAKLEKAIAELKELLK